MMGADREVRTNLASFSSSNEPAARRAAASGFLPKDEILSPALWRLLNEP